MGGKGLIRPVLSALVSLVALLAAGCSTQVEEGTASLPPGIESALVPDANLGGYIYVGSESPISVPVDRFSPPSEAPGPQHSPVGALRLSRATVALSTTPDDFSGVLEFAHPDEAQTAWSMYESRAEDDDFWGLLDAPKVHIVRGEPAWVDTIRGQVRAGHLAPLKESDPLAWNLVTNLPTYPEYPPLAVGAMTLDGDVLGEVAEMADLALFGLNTLFGFVRVDHMAFGVYVDPDMEMPTRLTEEFYREADAGVVMVANPEYPGFVVSFLLKTVSGKVGMERIALGDTAARYRAVDDLHLIVKNRGSLLYAAVSTTKLGAERLILSAIED